ncbi:NUDIX hydrolase [Sanguibacter antarcticus]|uniref:8-oxo-dGTP pyrophosphatase MutT (NUDIX family) n=1 Tax=Sanguibacter antarcticus TaxID=372484 RepID=A0A2A9E2K2_9MICO|nr:NUDIX domain-containing protein [Sanguibacter antarcticus]PFG33063.1 8-oxo-dGTP pyrophosphatase MutT (NUDIX family) [Sanguibacter antarcticus]
MTDLSSGTPDAHAVSGVPSSGLSSGGTLAGQPETHPETQHLDPGWTLGPDGMLTRHAARVIIVDATDRVLLLRGHDADDPTRHWWFTVGGGIDPGEDERDAAVREVFEETGLRVARDDLDGPVLTRSAIFDFARAHRLQHETFYVVRLDSAAGLSRSGWTLLESSFLDECAWLTLDELRAVEIEVFPASLATIVADLLPGWDGTTQHLGTEDENTAVG